MERNHSSRFRHYLEVSKDLEEKLVNITFKIIPHTLVARPLGFMISRPLVLLWYFQDQREISILKKIREKSEKNIQ
jgi:hypothetical protein